MKTRTLTSKKASILLLCAIVSSYSFVCLTKNCFSSAMVFITEEGYLNNLQTSVINAAFYIVYAIFQAVGGFVTDKFHPERFIVFGMIGAGACNLVIFFNQSYPVMLTMWALNGLLQFGVWPATFKLASTMTVPSMRSRALFIVTFANPIGMLLNTLVAAMIGSNWKLNFLVSAIGLIFIALLFEGVMRSLSTKMTEVDENAPQGDDSCQKEEAREECAAKEGETAPKPRFFTLLFSSGMIFLAVLALLRASFDFAVRSLTATMITQSYEGVTPVLATLLSALVLIMGAAGTALSYFLYPRFVKNEAKALFALFAVTMLPCGVMLFVGKVSYWLIIISCAVIALTMGAASLFTTSYISTRFNRYGYGATMAGLINSLSSLGVVLSFTLFPALSESRFGWQGVSVSWVLLTAISLALFVAILPLWSKFIKQKKQEQ